MRWTIRFDGGGVNASLRRLFARSMSVIGMLQQQPVTTSEEQPKNGDSGRWRYLFQSTRDIQIRENLVIGINIGLAVGRKESRVDIP